MLRCASSVFPATGQVRTLWINGGESASMHREPRQPQLKACEEDIGTALQADVDSTEMILLCKEVFIEYATISCRPMQVANTKLIQSNQFKLVTCALFERQGTFRACQRQSHL